MDGLVYTAETLQKYLAGAPHILGLPWYLSWWRIRLQCQRPSFDSWVGKILWRRNRLLSPVFLGFPGGSAGKESVCNAGDLGMIPGLGRSPGEGNVYPLQSSGLNSMDCIVRGVTKSQTQLSNFHFHFLHILGAALLFIIILDKGNWF